MKKSFSFLFAFIAFSFAANAQVYKGVKNKIDFFSVTPMENISATDTVATMLLNAKTGDVYANIDCKGFVFPNPLMQEHFNENYMETSKAGPKDAKGKVTYPNRMATFKGKIQEQIDYTKDGTYNITMKGTLTMHNVSKERTLNGTLTVKGGQVILDCKFDVPVSDHDITIPEAVGQKIAEVIPVTVHSEMVDATKKH